MKKLYLAKIMAPWSDLEDPHGNPININTESIGFLEVYPSKAAAYRANGKKVKLQEIRHHISPPPQKTPMWLQVARYGGLFLAGALIAWLIS